MSVPGASTALHMGSGRIEHESIVVGIIWFVILANVMRCLTSCAPRSCVFIVLCICVRRVCAFQSVAAAPTFSLPELCVYVCFVISITCISTTITSASSVHDLRSPSGGGEQKVWQCGVINERKQMQGKAWRAMH